MKVQIRAYRGWGSDSNQADALYSKLTAMRMDRRPLRIPDEPDMEILIEDIIDEKDDQTGKRSIIVIGDKRERQPSAL